MCYDTGTLDCGDSSRSSYPGLLQWEKDRLQHLCVITRSSPRPVCLTGLLSHKVLKAAADWSAGAIT